MSLDAVIDGVTGQQGLAQVGLVDQIGKAAARMDEIADQLGKAKDEDTARYNALKEEMASQAKTLTELKAKYDAEQRESDVKAALELAAAWRSELATMTEPSKARLIGAGAGAPMTPRERGAFLFAVSQASGKDAEAQTLGKATLKAMAIEHEDAWGKATLGTTDTSGGWVIPNAIVDEFIRPASAENIYRGLMTVVPGVTAAQVDIPYRSATPNRAVVAAFGATKENVDLAYNGYTATMYTLARIHDVGNQFLRQSKGAAETDVMQSLAEAFALGESYYVREGSGTSEPFGYTSALTNGPAAYRSTFTPSATTLAGSMAVAIATAAGAVAGRSQKPTAAVLAATSYWSMLAQGTDAAGFFFNPAQGPTAINAPPGTLVAPWGLPVYPDAGADQQNTAAVVDNLVVAAWKKFKLYFGENYRVDQSDQAGSRWDANLTGFRGEEEMGFDARPAVYSGAAQLITDITP